MRREAREKNGALKNERPGRRIRIAKAFSERHSAPLVWNARPSVCGPQDRSVCNRCHGASRANGRAHCARRSETGKDIVRRAIFIRWGAADELPMERSSGCSIGRTDRRGVGQPKSDWATPAARPCPVIDQHRSPRPACRRCAGPPPRDRKAYEKDAPNK